MARTKNKIKSLVDLRFPEAIQIFSSDRGCKTIVNVLSHTKEEVLSGKMKLLKHDLIVSFLKRSIGHFDLKVKEFKVLVEKASDLEAELVVLRKDIGLKLRSNGFGKLFDYCGINSINAALFVRDIQDIKRFYRYNQDGTFSRKKSLSAFKNFMGIAVTSNQSGEKAGTHKLVKAGCQSSRRAIMLLSFTYISLRKSSKYCLEEGYQSAELNSLPCAEIKSSFHS